MRQWLWGLRRRRKREEEEEEEKGVPSRPLGIWGWVALSLVSPDCSCSV